jgi:two-component system, NarL family, sensor histidine kinase BarA
MRILGPTAVIAFSRKALRWLVGGWSLHRKSLLFLGVALILPIGLAFWFLLQVVAKDLVMQTTRQTARDHARSVVAWKHVVNKKFNDGLNSQSPAPSTFYPDAFTILRTQLVDNPLFSEEFIMLDKEVAHDNLGNAKSPSSDNERKLLELLELSYRQRINQTTASPATTTTDAQGVGAAADSGRYLRTLGVEDLFEEIDEPVFDTPDVPDGGWYVYYHVIQFPENCIDCHGHFKTQPAAAEIPFCVVKVRIPYSQTLVASAPTVAVMIAIAMVTVALTLVFVHWVFRNIVLNPLNHLRTVSDEISRGNIYLRANIDTGDEFNELGDAFNRMLRHMTEGQTKLRELNYELDLKIEQLAQANLQLYEANRLKSDFLANMSHELRTPLNSILGFSDVLQGIELLNDKQRKYVSNIQSSGRVLLEMINEILDLAKMEAGKMKVSPATFDLPQLVQSQCNMLQSLLDEKNMDLQMEFAAEMPPVFQDQAKIQQILTNLLSNAIKFTPDGGLIAVQVGLVNDQHFFLTVTDTGVGIPESDFEIIFEKFRQSRVVSHDDGLTRQFSGTGLGLSIVKELCRLLGGEIRLTSQLGTGSTFQVILPVNYDPARSSQPNSSSV